MEHSCGAVLYRIEHGEPLYVLVGQPHLGFPKGHMEEGETEPETALREIKEETGIDAALDTSFCERIEYALRKNRDVHKQVTFFLATYDASQTPRAMHEIQAVRLVPYREAMPLLWHKSLQEVLKKAHAVITGTPVESDEPA